LSFYREVGRGHHKQEEEDLPPINEEDVAFVEQLSSAQVRFFTHELDDPGIYKTALEEAREQVKRISLLLGVQLVTYRVRALF
jgi:hypothetical protein